MATIKCCSVAKLLEEIDDGEDSMTGRQYTSERYSRKEYVLIFHVHHIPPAVNKVHSDQLIAHLGHNDLCVFNQSTIDEKVVNESIYAIDFDVQCMRG